MVEFKDGRTAHIGGEDIEEVKQYCADNYTSTEIDTIYLEVFCNGGEE
jgi:hypothetical protein